MSELANSNPENAFEGKGGGVGGVYKIDNNFVDIKLEGGFSFTEKFYTKESAQSRFEYLKGKYKAWYEMNKLSDITIYTPIIELIFNDTLNDPMTGVEFEHTETMSVAISRIVSISIRLQSNQ